MIIIVGWFVGWLSILFPDFYGYITYVLWLFFREILGSQQNWEKSTEIFHISPCSTHEKSPQLITALTRVIHLLQEMNLHWNTINNKVHSLQYSSLLLLYILWLYYNTLYFYYPKNTVMYTLPGTARRSNQWIIKEISSEYSLEGLMLKLKLQYFVHVDAKNWLIRKDPDAGKDWRQEKRTRGRDGWMASLTPWTWVWASSGRCWRTGKPGLL